jgi:hypothetical protein
MCEVLQRDLLCCLYVTVQVPRQKSAGVLTKHSTDGEGDGAVVVIVVVVARHCSLVEPWRLLDYW